MGIFNVGTAQQDPLQRLEAALRSLDEGAILSAFKEAIRQRVQVWTLGEREADGRTSVMYLNYRDMVVVPLLTSPAQFRPFEDSSLVCMKDITQLLDAVYTPPYAHAVQIDPFGRFVCEIESWKISELITACRHGSWGAGIPQYYRCEVMDHDDLISFAFDIIEKNHLRPAGIVPQRPGALTGKTAYIIGSKGQKKVVIFVHAAVAPELPELTGTELRHARAFVSSNRFDLCYYDYVSIGSTDEQRFYQHLALKGDAYYCKSCGLKELTL